jgi:hypothetical protein
MTMPSSILLGNKGAEPRDGNIVAVAPRRLFSEE